MKLFVFFLVFCFLAYFFYRLRETLGIFASIKSKSISGAWQAARRVLDDFQLFDIVVGSGEDGGESRYLPGEKTLRLAPADYESASFRALGVALYEVNRAILHMKGDSLVYAVTFFAPWVRRIGAFGFPLIFAGLIPALRFLYPWGVFAFSVYLVFFLFVFVLECRSIRSFLADLEKKKLFPEEELKLIQKILDVLPFRELTGLFGVWSELGKKIWSAISASLSKS
ncbi:MAG TPA: zinc metallopeptidase [Candidatus Omnitrophota bacterium]|nr:zinc metallopeptidase [Candidatus Omnitrophota bacterium]